MSTVVTIREWRPMPRNALLGFVTVELPSGMIIADVTILTGSNGPWASPPSKPQIGRDGTVLKDHDGKVKYVLIIEFAPKGTRERWSSLIIEALRVAHPEALA